MQNEIKVTCKNVFKTVNKNSLKTEFTRKWIELINQSEKNKRSISIQLQSL